MEPTTATFTQDDLAYIEAAYSTLEALCAERGVDPVGVREQIDAGLLPQPPYTLPDGRAMFPRDYFRLLDDAGSVERMRREFDERFAAAAERAGLEFKGEWNLDSEWTDYLEGTYAVCLWDVTPETMIEKERLIRTIRALDSDPRPESPEWRTKLAEAVSGLDAIERPFTDYDRARWEWTSRGLYITAMPERYPEAFPGPVRK